MPTQAGGFGSLVRKRRAACGLTQAELAERAGISERTVSDLERGLRTSVYPVTARQLAAALGVGDADLALFLAAAGRAAGETPFGAASRAQLPRPLTRLVGRQRELDALSALLRDEHTQLVTVLGPGGIGKTRLAVEAASLANDAFADGVVFVDLAGTDDSSMLLPLLATAVGMQPETRPLHVSLAQRLRSQRALVLLDTVEHLVAGSAALAALLGDCPSLTVLATSRVPLHIRGEHELQLHPLEVHADGDAAAPPAAVDLFLERATSAGAAVDRSDDSLRMVAEICRRVDGLPLAVELAAARLKHMQLSDLRARLEHRLDPLVGGPRDLPARQQTMRGTLDWSYQLLSPEHQRAFRALAVFRGSGASSAMTALVGGSAQSAAAAVAALIDASLMSVVAGSLAGTRYGMLDVVHEYAVERAAECGELAELRSLHAHHFMAAAERAEPELRGAQQRAWFDELLADEGNFRAALAWAQDNEGETALRLAGALWMFWRWAGLFVEGRRWLDAALTVGAGSPTSVRCRALWGAGWLAYHQGDYAVTKARGAEMLQLIGTAGQGVDRRNALTLIGNAAIAENRHDEAIGALSEAVALSAPRGVTWMHATSLLNLGTACQNAGDAARALPLVERALAMYEQLGDQHFAARALLAAGYARVAMHQPAAAARAVLRALTISEGLGDAWGAAEGLEAAATVLGADEGRAALTMAAAAARLRERISMRPHPSDKRMIDAQLASAAATLVAAEVARATGDGVRMSVDAAVAFALDALRARSRDHGH